MKNETYSTKKRPGDNIVFWPKENTEIFCKDLKGLCKYANEHIGDYMKYHYFSTAEYSSGSPIVFTYEPIFVIKETPKIKRLYRHECYLIRNENGTLSIPAPEALEHIFDFIAWKRELACLSRMDMEFVNNFGDNF